MNNVKDDFKIDFLDHVAIRVADLQASILWYEKVLGLQKYQLPEWGKFPVFMLAGKSGVALFPISIDNQRTKPSPKNDTIDHFAFNVSQTNFEKAKKRYQILKLDFSIQDHHYFHSIYTKDPDGHTVELTTLVVNPEVFYK
ncbi:VOC family protein [Maribacter sp. 2210JD10-5]|uniref:VOC family protein n=1 Tax=Maribacter sp. 2210JD10-5 TaxID=3386272 RepID=UPI0039BCE9CC